MKTVNPAIPYDHATMTEDIKTLSHKYPELLNAYCIGSSSKNLDIPVLKLGLGETKLLFVGAHHAREYATSAFLMYMAQEYADAYYNPNVDFSEYDVRLILNNISFYIVPMLNPDGVEIALKKAPITFGDASVWKANANGVDLNRNYPCGFCDRKDAQQAPSSENFGGKYPLSEPETSALVRFCFAHNFDCAAAFHTKGEEIYFADENSPNVYEKSKMLADMLALETGYTPMPVSDTAHLAGFENWFRAQFSRPCVLLELSPYDNSPIPYPAEQFFTTIWSKAKCAGLCIAEFALKK